MHLPQHEAEGAVGVAREGTDEDREGGDFDWGEEKLWAVAVLMP